MPCGGRSPMPKVFQHVGAWHSAVRLLACWPLLSLAFTMVLLLPSLLQLCELQEAGGRHPRVRAACGRGEGACCVLNQGRGVGNAVQAC